MRRPPPLALALALALGAARALAQPPADAAREAAALAAEGLAARHAGQDAAALAAFQRAYALAPRVSVQAQVGFALQALGRWAEAERALDAVSRADDPWVERHRATLDAARAAVRAHLGWLVVNAEPAGSEVLVEGERAPVGEPVRRPVGAVTVTVSRDGYYPTERAATIAAGETTRESVVLRPRAPELAAPTPTPAPAPTPRAPELVLRAPVAPPARPLRWWGPAAVAGAGAAALGLGAGLWIARGQSLADVTASGCTEAAAEFVCDARTANVPAARAAHDDAARFGVAGVVSFAVGAALVAAGAGWLLVEALARPAAPRAVTYGPGGLRWTF